MLLETPAISKQNEPLFLSKHSIRSKRFCDNLQQQTRQTRCAFIVLARQFCFVEQRHTWDTQQGSTHSQEKRVPDVVVANVDGRKTCGDWEASRNITLHIVWSTYIAVMAHVGIFSWSRRCGKKIGKPAVQQFRHKTKRNVLMAIKVKKKHGR